jgi:hypothetical protein
MPCEAFVTTQAYSLAVDMCIPTIAWGHDPTQFDPVPEWIIETDLAYWQKMYTQHVEGMGEVVGTESDAYQTFVERYVPKLDRYADRLPHHIFPYLALGYDPAFVEAEITKLGWVRPTDVSGIGTNCSANHLHTYLKKAFYSEASLESYLSLQVRKGAVIRDLALQVLETEVDEELANRVLCEIGLEANASALAKELVWVRRCVN